MGKLNFLADESVDRQIVDALRETGYDISWVSDSYPGITDTEVLKLAENSGAILLTGDKDFGGLVYIQRLQNHGVVLFRLSGLPQGRKAAIAIDAFSNHADDFAGSFSVITPNRVRVRRQR